ncbi:MAG: AraC family transcriptional regulator ligand-binding domain-containing protein [Bryobacteraceae bacterium]
MVPPLLFTAAPCRSSPQLLRRGKNGWPCACRRYVTCRERGSRSVRASPVPCPEAHRRLYEDYFGCPVMFGARRNKLSFRAEDVSQPFVTHNPEASGRRFGWALAYTSHTRIAGGKQCPIIANIAQIRAFAPRTGTSPSAAR